MIWPIISWRTNGGKERGQGGFDIAHSTWQLLLYKFVHNISLGVRSPYMLLSSP
jgi:hypothetical protein